MTGEARGAYFAAALTLLAVVLGLYYDAADERESKRPTVSAQGHTAPMPPGIVAPAENPRTRAAIASRPDVTHFRIGHRNVKSMYVDDSAMWVATTDGLIRYDMAREKHEFFDRKNGLASASVFFVGRVNGHVVAGTAGGQLCVFDESSRRWTGSAIPAAGAVLDVLETTGGEVWIANLAGVAQVPAGAIATPAEWRQHLPAEPVYALAEGKRGEIWFGTEHGVARYASARWDRWEFDGAKVRVVTLKVDARGSVWAGTWGKGLRRFDGKSWKTFARAQGLPGDHVLALFADRRGNLWIGTDKGLARLKNGRVEKPIGMRDGLIADKVFALATTSDDSLWVGGFGGVARIRPAGAL